MKKTTKPFTLIELLIVIVILGIAVSVALLNSNFLDGYKLNNAGRYTAAQINIARNLAMQYKLNYKVDFDTLQQKFSIKQNNSVIKEIGSGHNYIIDFSKTPYSGVQIKNASFNGLSEIEFTSTGKAINSGAVVLELDTEQVSVSNDILTGKFHAK